MSSLLSLNSIPSAFKNKPNLFASLIKGEPQFVRRDEFIDLHNKNLIMEEQLKFRRQTDLYYTKLKHDKVERAQKRIMLKNEIAKKRNEELIIDIDKNNEEMYEIKKKSQEIRKKLLECYNRYQNYAIANQKQISKEMLIKAMENQNAMFLEKSKKEKEYLLAQQNFERQKIYYEKYGQMNEELQVQINKLKKLKEQYDFETRQNKENFLRRKQEIEELLKINLEEDEPVNPKILDYDVQDVLLRKKKPNEENIPVEEIPMPIPEDVPEENNNEKKEEENGSQISEKEENKKKYIMRKQKYLDVNVKEHQEGEIDKIRKNKIKQFLIELQDKNPGKSLNDFNLKKEFQDYIKKENKVKKDTMLKSKTFTNNQMIHQESQKKEPSEKIQTNPPKIEVNQSSKNDVEIPLSQLNNNVFESKENIKSVVQEETNQENDDDNNKEKNENKEEKKSQEEEIETKQNKEIQQNNNKKNIVEQDVNDDDQYED